ncbi:MAG: tetratricopeptide repeat protein [Alphaproteobacteria bacterium]|nr:tetratricopeptide repeat protein [Alphaproteobacteria bacterium]
MAGSRAARLQEALRAAEIAFHADRLDEAQSLGEAARKLDPKDIRPLNLLGLIATKTRDLPAAIAYFERAIRIDPKRARLHANLAKALRRAFRLDEAEAALRLAITLDPRDPMPAHNLSDILRWRGEDAEALALARKAVSLAPVDPRYHRDLGHMLLQVGQIQEGFREREWRWQCADYGPAGRKAFSYRLWRGQPLRGQTLLLFGEEGAGDHVIAASLVPELLAGEEGTIAIETDARLVPLFQRSFAGARVFAKQDPPDPAIAALAPDFQIPMADAAIFKRRRFEDFPSHRGYLTADPEKVSAIRARYRALAPGPLIGIAWRSANKEMGIEKSLGLEAWGPILSGREAVFINLQYGECASDIAAAKAAHGAFIHDDEAIDQMASLDDFAAQIAALDFIVSISNTTVHMAGALGVPGAILLHIHPLWFWFGGKSPSPWYPSLQMIRQARADEWAPVIDEAAAALDHVAPRVS